MIKAGNSPALASPSNIDFRASVKRSKKAIEHWNALLMRHDDQAAERTKKIIEQLQSELEELESKRLPGDRQIGAIAAGSGRRDHIGMRYNWEEHRTTSQDEVIQVLDWALISITEGRQIENVVSETPETSHAPFTSLENRMELRHWAPFKLATSGDCVEIRVTKRGRTSAWTYGQINRTLANLNPKEDPQMASVYGYTMEKYGQAWCVGAPPEMNGSLDWKFCEGGDSGSIVLYDPEHVNFEIGTWLGLLFGRTGTGQGLMMPLDLVFSDIEKVTGYAVTLPKKAGEPSIDNNCITQLTPLDVISPVQKT